MTAPADAIDQALTDVVERVLGELLDKPLATVEEVAEVLQIGRTACHDACRRGELPSIRFGRRRLIPVPALAGWLLGAEASAHTPGGGDE